MKVLLLNILVNSFINAIAKINRQGTIAQWENGISWLFRHTKKAYQDTHLTLQLYGPI